MRRCEVIDAMAQDAELGGQGLTRSFLTFERSK
jgi:hypothetical protein